MIKIEDKALASRIKQGIASKEDLVNYLIKNCSIWQLADAAAELLMQAPQEKEKQITVSQEEFERIISLFKVRGIREGNDGNFIKETRGRKRLGVLEPIPAQ